MGRKLLIDTDPGNDDAIALYVALADPDIDVVGVTTVMGNTTLDNATDNALALLEHVDRTDIPVVPGAERPFSDELVTAEEVHGPGGLPTHVREALPEPTMTAENGNAAEFIIEQARTHRDDLTIAALGPQTNLALALAVEPRITDWVDDIYVMGGALSVTGNVTPMASFNFYVDAAAAARVVQDATPKIVGLDVTERVYVSTAEIERFQARPEPLSTMGDILAFSIDEVRNKFGNDGGLASDAVLVSDIVAGLLQYEDTYVEVDTTGGPSNGATIYDEHGVLDQPPNCKGAVGFREGASYQEIVVERLERFD